MSKKKRSDEDEDEEGYEFPPSGKGFLSGFREQRWVKNLDNRVIMINFPISDSLVDLVTLPIMQINDHDNKVASQLPAYVRDPITIYINSNGGCIDEALSVISAIEASDTPVHTVALGKACSAGFLILLAGHVRKCQMYSTGMFHQGSAGYIGKFADIEEYSNHFLRTQQRIHEIVTRRTGISEEMLDDIFRSKHDWYMEAVDMYRMGVVDEIIGVDMKELDKQLKRKRSRKKTT